MYVPPNQLFAVRSRAVGRFGKPWGGAKNNAVAEISPPSLTGIRLTQVPKYGVPSRPLGSNGLVLVVVATTANFRRLINNGLG